MTRKTLPIRSSLGLLVLLLGLLAAAPAAVRAEEEPQGDTPAEQAFREAWWAETAESALERALEHYRRAAGAEGPPRVRARARLREGLVLQRMGRMEEAIRALGTLEAAFPEQTEIHAKARRHLEAWTARDLRTSFEDWYERYQYSPEFQARVVDLVLQLGHPTTQEDKTAMRAEQELLTIGEPAVPALRAHVGSSNEILRQRAVELLLRLGHVPPADALAATTFWQNEREAWTTLLTLDAEEAERLRAALPTEGETAALLRAVLGDAPLQEALAGAAFPGSGLSAARTRALAEALVARADSEERARLAEIVVETALDEGLRMRLGFALLQRDPAPDEAMLARWLEGGPPWLLPYVADHLVLEAGVERPTTWKALLPALERRGGLDSQLLAALVVALEAAPADLDLAPVVRSLEAAADPRQTGSSSLRFDHIARRAASVGRTLPVAPWRRVLEAVIRQGESRPLREAAIYAHGLLVEGGHAEATFLLERIPATEDHELAAHLAQQAGRLVDADTVDEVLARLVRLPAPQAARLADGIGDAEGLGHIEWTPARLRTFAEALAAHDPEGNDWMGREIVGAFERVVRDAAPLDAALASILEHPSLPWGPLAKRLEAIARPQGGPIGDPAALAARVRAALMEGWASVPAEGRADALAALAPLWGDLRAEDAAPFVTWLRERLAAVGPAAMGDDLRVAWLVLEHLPDPTMADARRGLALYFPEIAHRANQLRGLERDLERYEALSAAARRHPDAAMRQAWWTSWVGRAHDGSDVDVDPSLRERALRDMLQDPAANLRVDALVRLTRMEAPRHLPLVVERLREDPDAAVRRTAAAHLGRLWDEEAVRALVDALDDPDPGVRDNALASLESIRTFREQRDRWRKELGEEPAPDDE